MKIVAANRFLRWQDSFVECWSSTRSKRRGLAATCWLVPSLVYQSVGNATNALRKHGRREERERERRWRRRRRESCFVWPRRGKRNAGNAFPAITIIHERLHYPFAARRLLFFIYGQAHYFCASKHMKNSLSTSSPLVLPPLVTPVSPPLLISPSAFHPLSFSLSASFRRRARATVDASPRFY